jgi:Flp pilus assembly protein TadG
MSPCHLVTLSQPSRTPRARSRRRAGAVLVEAALVLPPVLLLLIGLFEYARFVVTYNVVTNAVREGAEYAATHTSAITLNGTTYNNGTADVVAVVNSRLAGQSFIGQTINVYLSDNLGSQQTGSWISAAAGQFVCVQATGTYQFNAAALLFMPSSFNVSIKSVKQSEGN